MKLRQIQHTDAAALFALEQATMIAPGSMGQIESEIQLTASTGFVIESAGSLYGYAIFRQCQPECELLRLAVALPQRRNGLGKALVQQGILHFIERNYVSCFLEVRSSNLAAQKLYSALGFKQQGRRKTYYSNPIEDALLFYRQLTPK